MEEGPLPQRLGDGGLISLNDHISKNCLSVSLRKTALRCKTAKRVFKDLHVKGAEKESVIISFPKVNVLKRTGPVARFQEETCIKFGLTEEKVEAFLISI